MMSRHLNCLYPIELILHVNMSFLRVKIAATSAPVFTVFSLKINFVTIPLWIYLSHCTLENLLLIEFLLDCFSDEVFRSFADKIRGENHKFECKKQ